jgi:hypothetical protein
VYSPSAEAHAELAFVARDMSPIVPKLKIALLTPGDEVMARVREAAEWSDKAANHLPVAANISGIKLAYAGDGTVDPYAGFEERIVPANITLRPQHRAHTSGGNGTNEKLVVAKRVKVSSASCATSVRRRRHQRHRACLNLAGFDGGIREARNFAS